MPETYAYFYVSNFTDAPSSITELLGLEPTKAWEKGDAWLPTKSRPYSCWQIHSTVDSSEIFIDQHIQSVVDIIETRREQILELRERGCELGINCVGYYRDEHPGFGLSAALINRLAALSLDIDFDLYCWCNEDENTN